MSCDLLPFSHVAGACDRCGNALTGQRTRWCSQRCVKLNVLNHRWTQARAGAKRRDGNKCVWCGDQQKLEVNHIEPRNGGGYGWGCWNHQANLETLCHMHHVIVTNQQARRRNERELL